MDQNSKLLLILERANNKLEIKKNNNEYILEGIFGEIGVRNKNNRIYEESEYLAQLEELKEKIKKGKLLGELDHPQTFDISLKNVSHVIEDIYYDKENKQVKGRIRLLNTSAGKEAKALVDDGIPLHISSRAAGIVEENGRVKLKKLFTYDLVAEPGFESAELKKVNEAYGFANDDNIQIFEINKSFKDNNINFDLEIENNKNNKYNMERSQYVEINELNEYSKYLINEISELKNEIKLLKNSSKSSIYENNNFNELKEQVDNIKSYLDYIVKNLNEIFSNKINTQNEDIQNLIQYANYLAENMNNIIDYTNYLAEHSNHLIAYSDSLAENLEKVVKYANYLKENIETIGEHNNYLVENINKIKKSNNINKNNIDIHKENKIDEIEKETELYKNTITEKLNLLIESAKKYSLENNKDLQFLNYVNESKKKEFSLLSEDEKKKLINTFKYIKYTSPDEIEKIWESVIHKNNEPLFIKNMPEEYKEAWKKASPKVKNRIIAEAQLYNLNSQYAINTFWSTRDFRESQIELEKINESIENTTNIYNINSEYLAYFKNNLEKRFKKF